ncbi:MAG: hypothetical protein KAY24_08875 [Candidatus Eisenbacteria sp.]|nr:hypothetical protein [Candidatus Eisenbacteria bacterium]
MKEHQHIEWKTSWRDDYLKWICGFPNADGGVLVIGRNNVSPAYLGIILATTDKLGLDEEWDERWGEGWGEGWGERWGETLAKTPVETLVKTPQRIMAVLGAHPDWTLAQVAQEIGKSLSAVERPAGNLVKAGRLRYVCPRKGGHWEVLK